MGVYRMTCKKCGQVFNHASELQPHLMKKHGLSLEETYNPHNAKVENIDDEVQN